MGKLFTFLENFDIGNKIKIYDENHNLLFEGEMGDVPQKIKNRMSVIRGTAIWRKDYLEVKVRRS